MKRRSKLILLTVLGLCSSMMTMNVWAGKNGPLVIDFIGFNNQANAVIFTRTDWSVGDYPTELYTYRIDADSLMIDDNWIPRNDFKERKAEVLEEYGLADLTRLSSVDIPFFVNFRWDKPVKYYSKQKGRVAFSLPFTIKIGKEEYVYYQCSGESDEPNIIHLKIDANSGLLLVNFQGDCDDGNWRDSLIYYSGNNGKFFSKKLTPDDVLPMEKYKAVAIESETF